MDLSSTRHNPVCILFLSHLSFRFTVLHRTSPQHRPKASHIRKEQSLWILRSPVSRVDWPPGLSQASPKVPDLREDRTPGGTVRVGRLPSHLGAGLCSDVGDH